jgi:hypothetical protein
MSMEMLGRIFKDGKKLAIPVSALLVDGAVWLPVAEAAALAGAHAEETSDGTSILCRGDFCVPVRDEDRRVVDGRDCINLATVAAAFGLGWEVQGADLYVSDTVENTAGIIAGMRPPDFTLPDLHTAEPVSLGDFVGKKAIFYMWASW